jgi:GAF domain-containing protein
VTRTSSSTPSEAHGVQSPGLEAAWGWVERHASRMLAVGGLVAANIVVLELVLLRVGDRQVLSWLVVGLSAVQFLLLRRMVTGALRMTLGSARHQAGLSRQMLASVERFSAQAHGFRGTIEALHATASDLGCEAWIWEARERVLWSPASGTRHVLTTARARRLVDVLAARKLVHVADTSVMSFLPADIAAASTTRSLIVAPMWTGDDLIGLVIRRFPTRREMQRGGAGAVVSGVAALGAVAVGKAMVVDREQQRVRDIELLLEGVQTAGDRMHQDQLAEYARQLATAIGVDRAAVFAMRSGYLRIAGAHGIDRSARLLARRISTRSKLTQSSDCGVVRPRVIDCSDVDEVTAGAIAQLGFGSTVVTQPIHDETGCIGLVVVDMPESEFSLGAREATLVQALCRQIAMTLDRARMLRSMSKRSRHLASTPQLSRSLTGQRDPRRVAEITARELHDNFGYDRVSIALRSESGVLMIAASSGLMARSSCGHERCSPELLTAFETGRVYVSCASEHADPVRGVSISRGTMDPNAPAGCRSQVVVPIVATGGDIVGVITVYARDADNLGEDDIHILQTIADQVSGTFEQATLFDTLERSYFKTVEALSAALEAKDAYTLDHARSITELSAAVGRRLGMDDMEVRDLKLGALLHDIGKIGVPGEILNKPGPLTPEEFDVMKEHTVIGEQIIAPIEFLEGVRPLVLHEHERWDGAGYPHGLRGEEIPLGARIIFVCDAWHAMTSDRPYRKSLPVSEALERLQMGAGTQFDPRVVSAFIEVMDTPDGALLAGISTGSHLLPSVSR